MFASSRTRSKRMLENPVQAAEKFCKQQLDQAGFVKQLIDETIGM